MKSSRVWVSGALAGLAGLLMQPSKPHAQGLQVAPVTIEMAAGQMMATMTVFNHGSQTAGMQVRSYAWTQDKSGDQLAPADALSVSPPIFEVPAGGAQLIRVVLRKAATTTEDTYRLVIDQLPTPGAPGSMNVALRFSVPVFVEAPAAGRPELDLQVVANGASAQLVAINHGSRHGRIINPSLSTAGGGTVTVQSNTNFYVLAGSEQHWTLGGKTAVLRPGTSVHLTALSTEGPLDNTISVASH